MLYFSYGSNMSERRMKERVPSAVKKSTGILYRHKLKFHKKSKDGSGKCDAYFTNNPDDYILGVLYEIDSSEKTILDRKEGLGHGYNEKEVEIELSDGKRVKALTYYATNIDTNLMPYTWYKKHVVMGAVENNFSNSYIKELKEIKSIPDPDKEREKKEIYIYKS